MTELIMPRRKFLRTLVGIIAAPAVVKASSLMAIRPFEDLSNAPLLNTNYRYMMEYLRLELAETQHEMERNMMTNLFGGDATFNENLGVYGPAFQPTNGWKNYVEIGLSYQVKKG